VFFSGMPPRAAIGGITYVLLSANNAIRDVEIAIEPPRRQQ
jgi:hypothetical protein